MGERVNMRVIEANRTFLSRGNYRLDDQPGIIHHPIRVFERAVRRMGEYRRKLILRHPAVTPFPITQSKVIQGEAYPNKTAMPPAFHGQQELFGPY
jgi:hypothetical protein